MYTSIIIIRGKRTHIILALNTIICTTGVKSWTAEAEDWSRCIRIIVLQLDVIFSVRTEHRLHRVQCGNLYFCFSVESRQF